MYYLYTSTTPTLSRFHPKAAFFLYSCTEQPFQTWISNRSLSLFSLFPEIHGITTPNSFKTLRTQTDRHTDMRHAYIRTDRHFFILSLSLDSSPSLSCYIVKVKVKHLRGAFQWSRSHKWPDFPCPSEPGFGIMPLSSLHSLSYISFVWLGSYQYHG